MGRPFFRVWVIWRKASVMLRPRQCRSCFRDRRSQLISACLPKLAARVGLAPTPCGLTNRRATLTPPGNGAAGRTLTCIVPLRRRMPDIFDHGSNMKNGQRGRICTCDPSVPSRVRWLLRYALMKLALSMGLAPTLFPQTTGCFSIQLRERNGGKCR